MTGADTAFVLFNNCTATGSIAIETTKTVRLFSHTMFLPSSWCYKTFFGGNLDFPKTKKFKKIVLMSEHALKYENNLFSKKVL